MPYYTRSFFGYLIFDSYSAAYLEYPGVGRIILRWIFRMWDGGDMDWTDLALDKDIWRVLVNAVMNIRVS